MFEQWIDSCDVQVGRPRYGLVLNLHDYSEVVIRRPFRLAFPPAERYPAEEVRIDPGRAATQENGLLDLAGSMCGQRWCADDGAWHLEFPRGHGFHVHPDDHAAAWEVHGNQHGHRACPPGRRAAADETPNT
jgi:hypothetical protein